MKKIFTVIFASFLLLSCWENTTKVIDEQTIVIAEEISKAEETLGEATSYDIKQVASHSTSSNCWTIIDNKVYDLTSFFGKHDGWDEALEQLCWTYWDELFKMQHWWAEKPETTLKTMYKGEFK